MFKMFLGDF